MARLYTSDTHFGDRRALAFHRRPFADVAAMDAAMTARWNARVGPDDEVLHLGDFAYADRGVEAFARLNGVKRLVRGNNDAPQTLALPWADVHDLLELEDEGRRLVLCHYPLRSWNGMGRGALNLHGHSHGRLKPLARQIDVGVDVWDFEPQPLADLLARRARAGAPGAGPSPVGEAPDG